MTEDRKPATERKQDAPVADSTDFGQPVGSPGTRGGTTPYGGVEREKRPVQKADEFKG